MTQLCLTTHISQVRVPSVIPPCVSVSYVGVLLLPPPRIGDRGGTVVKVLCYKSENQLMSLGFFIDIKSFRSHYGPGVDSASNRNEYQEYFLRVKAAGA